MLAGPGKAFRWAGALLLVPVLLATMGALAFRGVGRWLVISDPLTRARAIVVLTGGYPFRAAEGAALHRAGWAPEVWLQRASDPAREAAFRRLGIAVIGEEDWNCVLLVRLGVPPGAIRILPGAARNTDEEVRLVWRELRRTGERGVVLVTSKAHTRRLRATWRAVAGSAEAMVRYARDDPFEPEAWWRRTPDALAVSRELLGLLNLWAGSPVRPGEAGAGTGIDPASSSGSQRRGTCETAQNGSAVAW